MKRSLLLGAAVLLAVLGPACGPSQESIQATVDAKVAGALATVQALPTVTPQPVPTPPATATPQPAPTPQPPPTPQPTPTAQPTATLVPTPTPATIPTPLPTATPVTFPTPLPTPTPVRIPATPTAVTLPPTPTAITLPPTPTSIPSAAAVYDLVRASIARVVIGQGRCSGSYIGDRWVLTAAHCFGLDESTVPTQTTATVQLDSQRVSATGTLVGWDRRRDVAVLRLPTDPGVPALPLRATGFTGVGQTVFIVGYPLGLTGAPLVTQGVISRFFNDTGDVPPAGQLVEYDVASASGGSGSPVLDAAGNIIGVHQASRANAGVATDHRFGVTSDEVLNVLAAIQGGSRG